MPGHGRLDLSRRINMIVTIAERKAQAIERLRSAFASTKAALERHAVAHGGRYVVFGSFARDDIRTDSDVDLMVDFPGKSERAAREIAETACRADGLVPDVYLKSEVSDALMRRILRDGVNVP